MFTDNEAVFTCTTRNAAGTWRLNETNIRDLPSAVRADVEDATDQNGVFNNLALGIVGRVEYNGTRVQCVIGSGGNTLIESEVAVLRIQGKINKQQINTKMFINSTSGPPSSVGSLKLSTNSLSVTISWTAPFSLDVTDNDDPDIWYSVLIYNVTDENNPTAILCTDCINITETQYIFTPDYTSPCHVYNFSVIPVNGAGQGAPTNATSPLHNLTISSTFELLCITSIVYSYNTFLGDIFGVNVTVFRQSSGAYKVLITAPLFPSTSTGE